MLCRTRDVGSAEETILQPYSGFLDLRIGYKYCGIGRKRLNF